MRYWNDDIPYGTSYGTSDWAVSTSAIPHMPMPNTFWYAAVPSRIRIVLKCDYCGNLQIREKAKCPFCGAPYKEMYE